MLSIFLYNFYTLLKWHSSFWVYMKHLPLDVKQQRINLLDHDIRHILIGEFDLYLSMLVL